MSDLRICLRLLVVVAALEAAAQPPARRPAAVRGPAPSLADIEYAPADPPAGSGHRLDLYIPQAAAKPLPLVLWTSGSAWMGDTGKSGAGIVAAELNSQGYAVAGVSVRSSSQAKFPGSLHDVKAAIRWLRANAAKYNLDPDRIAIMGDSSGGWTSAMAAVTGDAPEMEGSVGITGVSSAVQAAVAFYPPTNFATMDAWAVKRCEGTDCHDSEESPESRLLGCPIQSCPDKVKAASPMTYITPADPPIMILHGNSDPLVPHNQGEALYMALNKACKDAVFISLPKAGHGPWFGFLTGDAIREAATIRSTAAAGCTVVDPAPYTPSWRTVLAFLDKYLKAPGRSPSRATQGHPARRAPSARRPTSPRRLGLFSLRGLLLAVLGPAPLLRHCDTFPRFRTEQPLPGGPSGADCRAQSGLPSTQHGSDLAYLLLDSLPL